MTDRGMLEELTRLRDAFPALAQQVHDAPLAYLDNAATTQMPDVVLDAMQRFERHDRANIHRGVHTLSQRATDAFEAARARVRRFVGAGEQHEVVFTSGTTDSLNLLAHGLPTPPLSAWGPSAQGRFTSGPSGSGRAEATIRPGDEIIVSGLEHHANLVPWQQAARRVGARLRILQPDAEGRLQVDDLVRLLGPRTKIFALTACANATGERPPYEALLGLASDAGALTVLDAAQAVAHEVIDLGRLACDFLVFSAHKMHGPMGCGVLAGRRTALERLEPLRYGGDMVDWVGETEAGFAELPMRLEGGTPNVSAAVGLAAAIDFIDGIGRSRIAAHVAALRAHAVVGLVAIDGVNVLSPGAERSAIVSFTARDVHPHDLGTLLDVRGIAVRTGLHCAQPLLEHLGVGPTTRASFALYNTHEEVERLVAGVADALEVLR